MPTGVGPLTVTAYEDLARVAGRDRAFAVCFCFHQVVAPDDGHVAKVLDLSVREFEADEFASCRLKVGSGLKNLGLVLPLLLATTDDDRLCRHQCLKGLGVVRNRRGGPVTVNGISTILNNPFYIGVMRIKKSGQDFSGNHVSLVRRELFERVQALLSGKTVDRVVRHSFLFSRLVRCASCHYSLIGERRKGHTYYRCPSLECSSPDASFIGK